MASTTYLQQAYLAYFGRPADVSGLSFYADKTEAQVVAAFSASAESQAFFGSLNTLAQINTIYQNLFNRAAEPAGLTYWAGEINAGRLSLAQASMGILAGAQNADKLAVTNKLAAAVAFTAALDTSDEMIGYQGTSVITSARAYLASVDSTAASLTAATATAALNASVATVVTAGTTSSTAGSTYTLTTGVDSFTGTSGNDTFTGFAGTGATSSAADSVTGGNGTDTFRLFTDGAVVLPGTFTGFETFLLNDTVHQATTIASGALAGITNLTLQAGTSVAAAAMAVTVKAGDVVTLDTITDGDATSDTGDTNGEIDLAAASTVTSLSVTVSNVGATTSALTDLDLDVTGVGVATLNLTAAGTSNSISVLNAGLVLTAINISGSSPITIWATPTTATTINASTATGVVTVDGSGTSVRTITTGTANDKIIMGAGYIGGTSGATRDIIDGGAGTNILSVTTAIAAAIAANQSNLTNIQTIAVSDASAAVNMSYFTTATRLNLEAGRSGADSTVTVLTGTTVQLSADDGEGVHTLTVAGTATTDTVTLILDSGVDFIDATADDSDVFTGIETLNIQTQSTSAGTVNLINSAFTMTNSASSETINISGRTAITFTGTVTADVINASGLIGSAAILTLTAGTAGAAVITGGEAADVISASASADIITGGNGADTITSLAGSDIISLTETTAAVDIVVFAGGANAAAALTANGMDTITGFGSTDTLMIGVLGDGTTTATGLTTISAAAAQGALVDDTVVILNVAATAAALTTGGTATVTDFTNMTQVSAFLSERYTTTNDAAQENVIVWNVGTTSYLYHIDTIAGGSVAIAAAEIVLLGTITQGAALVAANLVYA